MSKPQLIKEWTNDSWRIGWLVDGELGLMLGQACPEDMEHTAASEIAATIGSPHRDHTGLRWESTVQAASALRMAKLAVRSIQDSRPWPEWTKEALAAGWKPPRGWRP